MYFERKINNNVAWVKDTKDQTLIAMGKGISFNKTKGQEISEDEIERLFKQDDKSQDNMLYKAIETIPSDILLLTEEISNLASEKLNIPKFDDSHFIALVDHLNYALKRSSESLIDYPENFKWEVSKLYPKEHDLAIDVLYFIEKKTGIRLPRSEQTFLTYHFVNAQYDSSQNVQSMRLAELINRAIEIIQYHYQMILNQNSVNYIRFVTHLRYFILRQLNHENEHVNKVNEQMVDIIKKNYRKAFQAAEKVGKMIETVEKCEVNNEELFYLTLHIERVTERDT